jgi:hypothetical protein
MIEHQIGTDRPALTSLIAAMRLSRRQRLEVARMGRRAKAAKAPRIRRLAREAKAEAKLLAAQARG